MITKATLESKVDQTYPIKQPSAPSDRRFVPARYHIKHDASSKIITIAMDHVVPS
jgi:hypothetical protein